MNSPCVLCGKHESDFDAYLCKECAKEFQVDSSNLREFYGFLARTGKSYLSSYLATVTDPTRPHNYIFSAPAASFHHARRFNFFGRMAELVRGVPGDIVECGVENGQSLMYWLSIAFDELTPRNVWGFDSFTGPEKLGMPDANADGDVSAPKPTAYAHTIECFINGLNAYGLPALWTNSHMVVTPGFFSETLKNYSGEKIAILHLDCNYFESYRVCLEELYPRVARGGVIVFDEYSNSLDNLHFAGAKRAIDEYLITVNDGTAVRRDKMYGKFFAIKGAH